MGLAEFSDVEGDVSLGAGCRGYDWCLFAGQKLLRWCELDRLDLRNRLATGRYPGRR